MRLLSNRQKAVLAQIIRRAYAHLVAKGQLSGSIKLDDWRHAEVERAVGKPGLRACVNADYLGLLSHFESLAAEDGRAFNALLREQTEPRRQAQAALVLAMDRAGLGPAYIEKICRSKYKCAVADASVQQIHKLIMDAKARGRARAKKAAAQSNPCQSVQSVSLNSQPSTLS